MRCEECQNSITDALYGELEGDRLRRFNEHVETCGECSELYEQMRGTLRVMDRRERPDPGQAFWDGYFNRLSARMEREDEAKGRRWLGRLLPGLSQTGIKWAYLGALAAVLIIFGAVVGRMILPGPGSETIPVATVEVPKDESPEGGPVVQAASAEACARQYLEDSQVLLLALVNFDPETEAEYLADISPEKRRSRELLAQAASFKGELNGPKQRRLRELVTELELILLQIANLESGQDLNAVDLIRSSVSGRDVMLKIDLEKMRGGDVPEPKPGACDV
jgi:hypothetical protein